MIPYKNTDVVAERLREYVKDGGSDRSRDHLASRAPYTMITVDSIVTPMLNDHLEIHDPCSICMTIDRSLSKRQIKSFNEYFRQKTSSKACKIDPNMKVQTTVNHEDSQNIPMLQVADYIASATQRKIELCN